jgi:FtsH-binding integral membrane protein
MKSIWFFVGLTLSIMGVLVTIAGILDYISPPERHTTLGSVHPSLWWGVLMVAAGILFLLTEKRRK